MPHGPRGHRRDVYKRQARTMRNVAHPPSSLLEQDKASPTIAATLSAVYSSASVTHGAFVHPVATSQ